MFTLSPIRLRLGIGLIISIVLDTIAQLIWKEAARQFPSVVDINIVVQAILQQPLFIALGLIFLLQLVVWLKVLEHADLSFAQPITALSYVSVCGLSMPFFGESISVRKLIGIGFILLGIWFISRGPATTVTRVEITS